MFSSCASVGSQRGGSECLLKTDEADLQPAMDEDLVLARALQAEEDARGAEEAEVLDKQPAPAKRQRGAATSATAERAALTPFAKYVDGRRLTLHLPDDHTLVNSGTYRQLKWGGSGHREVLHLNAPVLRAMAEGAATKAERELQLEAAQVASLREEWECLPFAVPLIPPREGCVYVTSESNEAIAVGSEMYCRIYTSEGVVPKQVKSTAYEAAQAAKREHEKANRDARKLYGETAALGVKLRTVRTKANGDCFFDAVCKAYVGEAEARRCGVMWRKAFGSKEMPAATEPPDFLELRAVVAAHFTEDQWLTAQALVNIGGEAFAFVVEDSLDATRANMAAAAEAAADRAYWADEHAIAVVQRYLRTRFLIFNPAAAAANQCTCTGEMQQIDGTQGPVRYVMLRHSHRTNKVQHYELLTLQQLAVLDEAELPPGVRQAFHPVCPSLPAAPPAAAAPAIELT